MIQRRRAPPRADLARRVHRDGVEAKSHDNLAASPPRGNRQLRESVAFTPTLADLAEQKHWIAWQGEPVPGKKPRKVPVTSSGRKARANTPSEWDTRARAEAALAKLPKPCPPLFGVGREFSEIGYGLSTGGIDLDTCRASEGELTRWAGELSIASRLIPRSRPSAEGVKLYFLYETRHLPDMQKHFSGEKKTGRSWKLAGDAEHPPAIELFVTGRYFAVTDNHLPGTPTTLRVVPLQTLLWLILDAGPALGEEDAPEQPEATTNDQQTFSGTPHPRSTNKSDRSRSARAMRLAVRLVRPALPRRSRRWRRSFAPATIRHPRMVPGERRRKRSPRTSPPLGESKRFCSRQRRDKYPMSFSQSSTKNTLS